MIVVISYPGGKRKSPEWGIEKCRAPRYSAGMLKQLIHWLIVIAVVLQLFSCVFLGQSFMPAQPF